MSTRTTRHVAAVTMVGAAAIAIAGFTGLGAVFDYPAVLHDPTEQILASYRRHQGAVIGWFLALVIGAALLAPAAVLLARFARDRRGARWVVGLGIAAATVQVVGLARWIVLVPGIGRDALDPSRTASAHHRFELLHTWLGEVLGETIGYALTAAFTVVVIRTIDPALLRRSTTALGNAAAVLIATGVLIPLGLHVASATNFVGYIAWTLWLVVLAVELWRTTLGTEVARVRAG